MTTVAMVLIALGISLAGNATLSLFWLGARDTVAKQGVQLKAAGVAAQACSDATDNLLTLADKRLEQAKAARAQAAAASKGRQQRADAILSAPASTPGDDCKSAGDRAAQWLKSRK
jgi:hypothetical protein